MTQIVAPGLRIQDAVTKFTRFRTLELNDIFYSWGRWYIKRTGRSAEIADECEKWRILFKGATMVRKLFSLETLEKRQRNAGTSYDQFMLREQFPELYE